MDREALEARLVRAIQETPTGKHLRRLWFLYEFLTRHRLPLPDVTAGNYVPLLDASRYYTGPGRRSRRHRVLNNLLGNRSFCPLVRRTESLVRREPGELRKLVSDVIGAYDESIVQRALSYLHTKETLSSFEIEHERPPRNRAERFVLFLKEAPRIDALTDAVLIRLQQQIVDPRFANEAYRSEQNYVGESVDPTRQILHFISPRPEDVPSLMEGLLGAWSELGRTDLDPVIVAAVISFGFVFIHPFSDGNGRLHRFLIHYVLSRAGLVPEGIIIPVSALMLNRRAEYDACLESFSRRLMPLIDYELDADGAMVVHNPTVDHYRYFDAHANGGRPLPLAV